MAGDGVARWRDRYHCRRSTGSDLGQVSGETAIANGLQMAIPHWWSSFVDMDLFGPHLSMACSWSLPGGDGSSWLPVVLWFQSAAIIEKQSLLVCVGAALSEETTSRRLQWRLELPSTCQGRPAMVWFQLPVRRNCSSSPGLGDRLDWEERCQHIKPLHLCCGP